MFKFKSVNSARRPIQFINQLFQKKSSLIVLLLFHRRHQSNIPRLSCCHMQCIPINIIVFSFFLVFWQTITQNCISRRRIHLHTNTQHMGRGGCSLFLLPIIYIRLARNLNACKICVQYKVLKKNSHSNAEWHTERFVGVFLF